MGLPLQRGGGAAEVTDHTSASVADEPGREDQSDSVRADSGSNVLSPPGRGRGGGPIGGKDSSPSGAPSAPLVPGWSDSYPDPYRPGYGAPVMARWERRRARHRAPVGRAWPSIDQPCLSAISLIMANNCASVGGFVPPRLSPGELYTPLMGFFPVGGSAGWGSAARLFMAFFFFLTGSAGSARDWPAGGAVVVGGIHRWVRSGSLRDSRLHASAIPASRGGRLRHAGG